MPDLRDPVIRRIVSIAAQGGVNADEALDIADPARHPRWNLGPRWIEFECGCRAERFRTLVGAANFDPIIFRGLPEQAVYDRACPRHEPSLNTYVHFGGYVDFNQWRTARLKMITGN